MMNNSYRKVKCLDCDKLIDKYSSKTGKCKSCSHKGIKFSSERNKKISLAKLGEKNPMWRGNNASLSAIHQFVKVRKVKPKLCENCGVKPVMDLANISQNYLRDLTDWEWLCRRCHMLKDGRMKNLKKGGLYGYPRKVS